MGSLRNPVGPLPSTIYWRRRAILLALVVVLALLVIWAVAASGGGSDDSGADAPGKGGGPASSITPGPSGTGPAISQHPGGRDESDTGGGEGDGGEDGGSGGEGSGDEGGSGGSGGGAGGAGDGRLPEGSSLANCPAKAVKLTLRSASNRYAPGETPRIEITAKNSSDKDCKVDLGGRKTVLTITKTEGDVAIWSSEDCPKGDAAFPVRVPADGSATRTLTWNRDHSAPECATPKDGPATPGTYLAEAKAPGVAKAQTSFVLKAD
ncbi:hypothetical protein HUT18_20040 [Streptomyces sp. NA04227]|uniref:hypothetical protein n=1 Tax=Streptomyces sp. NA04227 TaxID=2742136 RepID=UPI001590F429|nr:hypothetical protein [Streptomyces sp. NA04227]QKW08319.1 hypothetical protein HUT18_20040 [Streptomyces sp. NA04227]